MKYVFIFLTFLSVCTTLDVLQIPLTLDATRTIKVPPDSNFAKAFSDTITIKASDDPDFQRYLDKIKGYTIESVSYSTSNLTGIYANYGYIESYAVMALEFIDLGFTTSSGMISLGVPGVQEFGFTGDQLAKMAGYIQQKGSLRVKVTLVNLKMSNGGFDLNLKLNVKVKL